MKKIILILLLTVCGLSFAQEDAWVYLKDKPQVAYYLTHPLEMLSQRALNRRSAQGLSLNEQDVPVHPAYISGVAAAPGITVKAHSKWLNALHVRGSVASINALAALPYVDVIDFASQSLNTTGKRPQPRAATATGRVAQAAASFNYGNSATQITMLNGQVLHQQEYTGSGKMIAVMDNGFPGVDTTQPFQRLRNNGQLLGGYNYVSGSTSIYSGGSHGTMVLSSMGGYSEGELIGTAPDASYYLFVTEDADSENPVEESYWVQAAEAADSLGVDVINTSLGYFTYDNPSYSHTYTDLDGQTAFISRGANAAFSRGMVVVVSAGNSGATDNPYISVPADAPGAFTIGAVNASEVRAAFSSIGPTADGRIKPDVMAMGVSAVVATPTGSITTVNGTSLSGPVVCGLATCLWQAFPQLTNQQLVQLIKQSADRYNNPDNLYGYGIPDFAQALLSTVSQPETQQRFILYPNPASEDVRLNLPEGQAGTLTLFNALGQVVLFRDRVVGSEAVDISGLPAGIYTYRAKGTETTTGRLVKK